MKKIKSFPKKPKLVQSPNNIIWGFKEKLCDCNICRLNKYKDHTAYYAYLVAEVNNLNALIEILKDLMFEFNLNQSEFANKIGVKQSQVSEWLKGKSKPGYDNIKAICLALDISADRLLGLDEHH